MSDGAVYDREKRYEHQYLPLLKFYQPQGQAMKSIPATLKERVVSSLVFCMFSSSLPSLWTFGILYQTPK